MPQPGAYVFLCHTDAGDTFRVGSQHLVKEFARRGHRVLRVSLPNSPMRRIIRSGNHSMAAAVPYRQRTWHDADGVFHLELNLPAPLGRGPRSLIRAMDALCARKIRQTLPWDLEQTTACIVDEPRFVGVCQLLRFANLVYRPTDFQDHDRTKAAELAIAPLSASVVATSSFLRDHLPPAFSQLPSLVLPNAVDFDAFHAPNDHQTRPRAVVYVGSLDDRFDLPTVVALSAAFPSVPFNIYGPLTRQIKKSSFDTNLTFYGPVNYDRVPPLLHGARVGLLPLSNNALNAGRSPMKLFEYLAAGLNVVSRRIPSLETLGLPNVLYYSNVGECVAAVGKAIELGVNREGVAASVAETWGDRAERLLEFIDSQRPGRRDSSSGPKGKR